MGRKRKRIRRSLIPEGILDTVAYIDTVVLILRAPMPAELDKRLTLSVQGDMERRVGKPVPTANGFYQFELRIQQPTEETYRVLAEAADPPARARVVRVDVALDLITKRAIDAWQLQLLMEERLMPSMRLQTRAVFRGRTIYYNKKPPKGVEVLVYSDLPSKVTGDPCMHIDWRLHGASALKLAELETANGLPKLDFTRFFDRRLALWRSPQADRLAQIRSRRTGEDWLRSAAAAGRLLRAATGENGVVVTHNLLHLLRWMTKEYGDRPQRLFTREPHDWMLPAPDGAPWRPLR